MLYVIVAVNGLPSTEYEYGAIPPVTVPRVNVPFEAPQLAFVIFITIAVGAIFTVIVIPLEVAGDPVIHGCI